MPYFFPTTVILVFLSGLSLDAQAQNTIAECGPSLLPLAPCAPFVQGMSASPAQLCCHGLDQLYSQEHTCLCLLLHDSTLSSSFPVNRTLALQLPLLCKLQIDISTCTGTTSSLPVASHSPPSQVTFDAKPNSSVVQASPVITVVPKPKFTGLGLQKSGVVRAKAKRYMLMLVLLLTAISIVSIQYVEI
ncbi:hypothetical protein CASFOL_017546 [Castilleja foliolosa]|uniref:Bifunctional inhibitor/plant lipid transfer protein/seed storage helical domain-containing protein n=1 Tax=Castilleja foliolosa TaxID=1961234 RepID=A0ABD3DEW3_9LAMI